MMKRAEQVKDKARQIIDEGRKPSAKEIAEATEFTVSDVHRCLNSLEREKKVETYTKEIFGRKHRFVGVKRE